MSKFTKEEVIKELDKLLKTDRVISGRTIDETVETLLAFTTDETELSDFAANASKVLSSFDGNERALKADYERQLQTSTQKSQLDPKASTRPAPNPEPKADDRYNAIKEQLDELLKERIERAKTERLNRLKMACKDLPSGYLLGLEGRSFDTDEDVDAYASKLKSAYEQDESRRKLAGATNYKPGQGSESTAQVSDAIAAKVARMRSEVGEATQPTN